MIEIRNVSKIFGGVKALQNVSFEFEKGEFLGLIGPNGSGKTTLFNLMSGTYGPTAGEIFFEGKNVTALSPDKICHAGIARTFQIPKPILSMSLAENVMVGLLFGNLRPTSRHGSKAIKEEALGLLDFVGLKIDAESHPGKLTAGELRKLELARALATKPKLLLADEVLSGLNKEELKEATGILKKIRDNLGITIIWVEHIMAALMSIVDRVVVLSYGELIADGTPEEISNNPVVIEAYLGED